nr:hypothetical protein [uncultured Arsenicibacter sp.]
MFHPHLLLKSTLILFLLFIVSCNRTSIDSEPESKTKKQVVLLKNFSNEEISQLIKFKRLYERIKPEKIKSFGNLNEVSPIIQNEEIAIWGLAKLTIQDDPNKTLITVPCLQTNLNQIDFDQLVFAKEGDNTKAFRLNIKPKGSQENGFSGIITVKSFDKSYFKSFEFKNGEKTGSGRTGLNDDDDNHIAYIINLPEVTVRAQSILMEAGPDGTSSSISSWQYDAGGYSSGWIYTPESLLNDMELMANSYQWITNQAERAILDNLGFIAHVTYRANAIEAALEARARFMQWNCNDDPCNAYQHAYFNALNASSYGIDVARSLGRAHEGVSIDPITMQPIDFGCNDTPNNGRIYMDLVNNERGYQAYNQWLTQGGYLSAIIQGMANSNQLMNWPGCP